MPFLIPAGIAAAGAFAGKKLAGGGGSTRKEANQAELARQKAANEAFLQDLKIRKAAFQNIEPFAKAMLALGLDPASILSSPLGVSLLMPGRMAIADEFEAARSQLVDFLGSRGLSTQSGVGIRPLANLFGQEAQQQSQLVAGLPLQAVQLGLQGANLLNQQQAVFNPAITGGVAAQAGANILGQPQSQTLNQIIGASGSALSGFLGRPQSPQTPIPIIPSAPGPTGP